MTRNIKVSKNLRVGRDDDKGVLHLDNDDDQWPAELTVNIADVESLVAALRELVGGTLKPNPKQESARKGW
jgi:hypothetical protein